MNENLVTIGIPTRKTKPMIYNAIKSILNQTYKNFEILICDDSGEPDNERITELKKSFKHLPNFRVVSHDKNLGIGAARRTLVNEAKGKYVCFLSADDEYLPEFVEKMVSVILKHPNNILYSDYYIMNEAGKIIGEFKAPTFLEKEDFIMGVISSAKRNTMFVVYNLFAPTDLLKKHNFDPDFRFGEDLEHLLRCVLVEDVGFLHVPKTLSKYCARSDSITGARINNIRENNKRTFAKINKLLGKEVL